MGIERNRLILFTFVVFITLGFFKMLITPVPGKLGADWVYEIPPKRGGVFDSSGRSLAMDRYIYRGYIDLDFLRRSLKLYAESGNESTVLEIKSAFSNLLNKLGMNDSVENILSGSLKFLPLGDFSSRTELLSLIPRDLLPYVSADLMTERKRLNCCSIPQIVGSVIEGEGKGGVEGYFDSMLRGKSPGKLVVKIVKLFKIMPSLEESEPPENGEDIKLSIDLELQKRVFQIVDRAVKRWKAESGNALIMETKTGKIRAMVTTRSWNDTVLGYIEPGSSIKPVIYSIALETGSVDEKFHHFCEGWIKPVENLNIVIRDIDAHGDVDLEKALVQSCNTATVKIASILKEKIGLKGMYDWLRKFGFGERTGIEIEGEIKGVLRPPKEWSAIDFAEISIGQGIGVTPIQLISALNTLFNLGVYVKPTLLEDSTPSTRRVVSKDVAETVRSYMEKVVEEGTGKKAHVRGVKVAGKTGTAQKASKGAYRGEYHSIFVGAFPADDPEYTVLVHLDSPKGEYLGGDVAAPIFAEIVETILKKNEEKPLRITPGVTPNLTGLSLKDAILVSKKLGLKLKIFGSGLVVKQSPEPGTLFPSTLTVWLNQPK